MTIRRTWMFSASWLAVSGLLLTALVCEGCASRGNLEVLEAQLRSQESLIARYEQEMLHLQNDLTASQREMDIVRSEISEVNRGIVNEETVHNLARAEGLVFHSMFSAARDQDQQPGDESFQALLYPHDADGEIVKLSGKLTVEAIDPLAPAGQKSMGHWEFTSEEARKLWHSGILSSGFQVSEKWAKAPRGENVILTAQLQTTDGRVFEASHSLPVHVRAGIASAGTASAATVNGADLTADPPPALTAGTPRQLPSLEESSPISAETRTVPPPSGMEDVSRPDAQSVPRPLFELPPENDTDSAAANGQNSTEAGTQTVSAEFRPSPRIDTSDRWTDDSIPVYR